MRLKVYDKLSGISPIAYLVIYLLLVPAFALIYYSLPGQQFYAPYAKLEPKVTADSERIKTTLQGALRSSVQPMLGSDWSIDSKDVTLVDFIPDDRGKVTLTFVFGDTR